MALNSNISAYLEGFRKQHHWTYDQIADAARQYGVQWSSATVQSMEHGARLSDSLSNMLILASSLNDLLEKNGQMFICADHGNAEKLVDTDGSPFTAHTTNPVPFVLVNYDEAYTLREGGCLADIVPTLIEMMGMEQPKEMTGKSLLIKK